MKKIIILFVLLMTAFAVHAQVAINKDGSSPTSGSILDVKGSGNHHFYIDDTNGHVGINTITPGNELSVDGSIQIANYTGKYYVGPYQGLSWSTSTGSIVLGGSSNSVELRAHNNILMFLNDTNANIGINTTSPEPSSILDVQGGSKWIQFQTDDGYGVRVLESDAGNNAVILNGYSDRGNITLFNNGTETINLDANPSLPSYILTKKFGIGTTTPNYPLHIHDNGTFSFMQFTTPGSGTGPSDGYRIGLDTGLNGTLGIAGPHSLRFLTNSLEQLTITGVGNVGIGTPTPGEKLDVDGNMHSSGDIDAGGEISADGDITANGDLWGTNGNLTDDLDVGGNIDSGGNINADGDVTANGDLWGENAYITTNMEVGDQLTVGGAVTGSRQVAIKGASGRVGLAIEADGSGYAALYLYNNSGSAIQINKGSIGLYGASDSVNLSGTNSDLNLNGANSSLNINGTGEVNRAAQGNADLVPIAYGVVKYDGTILNSGTGNWSVNWNSTYKQYEISITGETYFYADYITQATLLFGGAITIQTGSVSGNLIVQAKNSSGAGIQNTFSFIVYKP